MLLPRCGRISRIVFVNGPQARDYYSSQGDAAQRFKSGRRPRHRCSKDPHASTLTCVITFAARLTDPVAALFSEGLEVYCSDAQSISAVPSGGCSIAPERSRHQVMSGLPTVNPLWPPRTDQPYHMTAFISIN